MRSLLVYLTLGRTSQRQRLLTLDPESHAEERVVTQCSVGAECGSGWRKVVEEE